MLQFLDDARISQYLVVFIIKFLCHHRSTCKNKQRQHGCKAQGCDSKRDFACSLRSHHFSSCWRDREGNYASRYFIAKVRTLNPEQLVSQERGSGRKIAGCVPDRFAIMPHKIPGIAALRENSRGVKFSEPQFLAHRCTTSSPGVIPVLTPTFVPAPLPHVLLYPRFAGARSLVCPTVVCLSLTPVQL